MAAAYRTLSLDRELADQIEQLAQKDSRSLRNFVELHLRRLVEGAANE